MVLTTSRLIGCGLLSFCITNFFYLGYYKLKAKRQKKIQEVIDLLDGSEEEYCNAGPASWPWYK